MLNPVCLERVAEWGERSTTVKWWSVKGIVYRTEDRIWFARPCSEAKEAEWGIGSKAPVVHPMATAESDSDSDNTSTSAGSEASLGADAEEVPLGFQALGLGKRTVRRVLKHESMRVLRQNGVDDISTLERLCAGESQLVIRRGDDPQSAQRAVDRARDLLDLWYGDGPRTPSYPQRPERITPYPGPWPDTQSDSSDSASEAHSDLAA